VHNDAQLIPTKFPQEYAPLITCEMRREYSYSVLDTLKDGIGSDQFLDHLDQHGVLAMNLDEQRIRFVFHLDITDAQFDTVLDAIGSIV
jgi:hypothetical protein